MNRSEKSAEAVVAAGAGRRAEREGVREDVPMSRAMRQMPERSGRAGAAGGEAARESASDEARGPRYDTEGTGSGSLLAAALTRENLQRAWRRVKANKGSAGVDGLDIDQSVLHLKAAWPEIRERLLRATYRPSPVRRVTIPKPDGGQRELGIPTVTDRLIQQALLQVLQPLLDPTFSEHSYGFRPGRRAHDAVLAAQAYVQSGRRGRGGRGPGEVLRPGQPRHPDGPARETHRGRGSAAADPGVPERRDHERWGGAAAVSGHAAGRAVEPVAGQRAAR